MPKRTGSSPGFALLLGSTLRLASSLRGRPARSRLAHGYPFRRERTRRVRAPGAPASMLLGARRRGRVWPLRSLLGDAALVYEPLGEAELLRVQSADLLAQRRPWHRHRLTTFELA